MSRHFLRDQSLKTFENEEHSTLQKNENRHLPNFFTQASDKNENYSEVWFRSHQMSEQNKNANSGSSLNRMNCSSYMSLSKNESRKPLNDLLKSNNDSSVQASASKPPSRVPKEKAFYKTSLTEGNELNFQKLKPMSAKKSRSKEHQQIYPINLQSINESYDKNLSRNRLKESVKHVKILQQQVKQCGSRSRSGKKKGLECTLYEKSLQKKINESNIKSTKKLITIKKRFQKTQQQWGMDKDVAQKDIKKILLKKKNNEERKFNNTNCFSSVILNRSKEKRVSREKSKNNLGSASRPMIGENIRSVSKNKKQAYADLSRSMQMIIQSCKNQQFTTRQRSNSKSIERPRLSSVKKQLFSESKNKDNLHINISSAKGQKIIMNQRIQLNLKKIQEKYKFIMNYLTDFDIICKLNGYEIAQIEQCKWILLVIDDVYEMIKHSQHTKLKGIEYSRDYEFRSGKKEEIQVGNQRSS